MLFLADQGHFYGRYPWVSVWLVVANVLVFWVQVKLGAPFTNGFSLVPEEITTFQDITGTKVRKVWVYTKDQRPGSAGRYVEKDLRIQHYPGPMPICLTLLTSMFMHGNFLHLFFNMWSLLIFGRNVECAMGHGLFLAFYLLCGLLAGLGHIASDPHSLIPYMGASGAIAGLMGAYVSIYPLNMIKVWFFVSLSGSNAFSAAVKLPAILVIGLWLIVQYLSAMYTDNRFGGIAYWAHLGGFFAGFILLRLIVLFLQQQKAQTDAARQRPNWRSGPLTAANPKELSSSPPVPDPFADFVTMQTIRRIEERKNRGQRP